MPLWERRRSGSLSVSVSVYGHKRPACGCVHPMPTSCPSCAQRPPCSPASLLLLSCRCFLSPLVFAFASSCRIPACPSSSDPLNRFYGRIGTPTAKEPYARKRNNFGCDWVPVLPGSGDWHGKRWPVREETTAGEEDLHSLHGRFGTE